MSPQEMRSQSTVETPEEPQDPFQHWRGILRFWPKFHMRTSALEATGEVSQEAPHNLHGD